MEARTTTQRQLPMLVRMDWPDPSLRGLELIAMSIAVSVEVAVEHATETVAPEGQRYRGSVAVRKISLNSPLDLLLTIHAVALASVGTLSLLAYGLKRLCGLDLEIRTHRAELQADLLEANNRAALALQMRQSFDRNPEGESLRRTMSPTRVPSAKRRDRLVADMLAPSRERIDPDLVTKVEDAKVGHLGTTGEATIEDTAA